MHPMTLLTSWIITVPRCLPIIVQQIMGHTHTLTKHTNMFKHYSADKSRPSRADNMVMVMFKIQNMVPVCP